MTKDLGTDEHPIGFLLDDTSSMFWLIVKAKHKRAGEFRERCLEELLSIITCIGTEANEYWKLNAVWFKSE